MTTTKGSDCKGNCEGCHQETRLMNIKNKILVLSGKGGVGKSTVAVNLAKSLALKGHKVGLLDVDIHGPSVPKMLGVEQQALQTQNGRLRPIENQNMKIMSVGFLLPSQDNAVIWRGPMKHGLIKQFIEDVEWGELDYLVVDCPPGTGDEPLAVAQLLNPVSGALLVTTPQSISMIDVCKSVDFCHKLELPILGIVENMSGFVCPKCKEVTHIFGQKGGQLLAEKFQIPFLGIVPIDPRICTLGDQGQSFVESLEDSEQMNSFQNIVTKVCEEIEQKIQNKKCVSF